MKHLKFILITATSFILFSAGCKKSEFLKEDMRASTSLNNFFTSPNDCELALTGVYSVISNGGLTNHDDFTRGILIALAAGTDEYAPRWDAGDSEDMSRIGRLSVTPLTPGYTKGIWRVLYAGINRANILIDNIDKVNFANPNQKTRIIAEAHFLRGFYLFYASMMWGAVPIPLHNDEASLSLKRSSIEEVYKQVEADLTAGYNDMGEEPTVLGRASKYTAAAFLTKMYIYLSSCKENNISSFSNLQVEGQNLNDFTWVDALSTVKKADDLVKDVYNNSGYSLVDSYKLLFYPSTKAEQYKEFLFEAECEPVQAWALPGDFLVAEGDWPTNGGSGSLLRPPTEMAGKYDSTDVRYLHNVVSYIPLTNDTAFHIEQVGGRDYGIPLRYNKNNPDQISIGKIRQTMPYENTIPAWAGTQNIPIIRFAEVILWYAETRFKLGDEVTARSLLYKIRLRAAGGNQALADQLTNRYKKTDFMKELMEERSRELIGEGQRRCDLIRTGTFKSAIFSINTDRTKYGFNNSNWEALQQNYKDTKIWYPIDQSQIAVNPNLVQNPGY